MNNEAEEKYGLTSVDGKKTRRRDFGNVRRLFMLSSQIDSLVQS
jgi:hypothetical protein